MIDAPILIAGCPRSGTSLTAHTLRIAGAWVGRVNSLCEHVALKNQILKPMLRAGGMDDRALTSFADVEGDPDRLRAQVEGELEREGYDGGRWMFKDVKLVFCWPTWALAFPNAIWVTVWRRPPDIVASFERWGLSGVPGFDGETVIREHQARAIDIPAHRLWPSQLVEGESCAYQRLCRHAGLAWDQDAVDALIDPDRFQAA